MLRRSTSLLAMLVSVLAIVLGGCVGTPVPQPPALDPPDVTRIEHQMVGSVAELVGEPGAAEPGTELWVVNLDGLGDPATVEVLPDGSFSLFLSAATGDELRLQARDGEDRSRPVDVLVPRGEIVRVTEDCLELEPALELRLDAAVEVGGEAAATIRVSNGCASEVRIDAVELRRPSDAWSIDTPGPITVPVGGTADVQVRFGPTTAALHEEILFLRVSAPETDRRPVTLSGVGR